MSYDNLSGASQNVLKFYQQLTDVWSEGSVMFWLWKKVGQMWGAGVYLNGLCSQ